MSAGLPPMAKVVCEAAIACAVGRPLDENPFDQANAPDAYYAWRWSWRYADVLLVHVSAHEVEAWLAEQDDAA